MPELAGQLAGAEDTLPKSGDGMRTPSQAASAAPQGDAQTSAMLPKDLSAPLSESAGPARGAATHSLPLRADAQAPARTPQDIAVRIARGAQAGQSRFEIRLDPPELGRIDIRLELSADGRMQAVLQADKPETLDMLQRDARALERALAEQGIDMSGGGLNFALRQEQQGENGGPGYGGSNRADTDPAEDMLSTELSALEAGGLLVERRLGVDMRI